MPDKYVKVQKKTKKAPDKTFHLNIDISTVLHIEMPNLSSKVKLELLGIKQSEYLIVNLPTLIDSEFFETCNENTGTKIICRYVFKGAAYGFRSELMGIVTSPISILVFKYPEDVEECNLRRYQRVNTILPSRIKFGPSLFYGSITDISEGGCQFAILHSLLDAKDFDLIKNTSLANVSVILKLPGVEKDLVVPAIRKSLRRDSSKVYIGIQFNSVDKNIEDTLRRFIADMHKYSAGY